MIGTSRNIRVWAYPKPCDLRKGYNGLSALVQNELRQDVLGGDFFLFVNRRRTLCKVIHWDTGGFIVFYKRLERGRFQVPKVAADQTTTRLDSAQLTLLLEGIDFSKLKRPKLWEPQAQKVA